MTQKSFIVTNGNCHYRGEGNACLVVRLKKERKVLRLVKEECANYHDVSAKDVLKKLEDHVASVKCVMKPLLGENFVHCPVIVPVCAEEVKEINKIVQDHRPIQRQNKTVKEIDTYVLLLPDYCCLPPELSIYSSTGPVISIEIKPKQGFMKTGSHIAPSQSSKSHLCSFCMMQYYKLRKKAITVKSGYCPMDLFSGCPKRMHHALQELFKTPQNNFRIFMDQELVYSDESKPDLNWLLKDFFECDTDDNYSDRLCKLVTKVLLTSFPPSPHPCDVERNCDYHETCINSSIGCFRKGTGVCQRLPNGCVLDRILKIQMLDSLEINELYQCFMELTVQIGNKIEDTVGTYSQHTIPPFIGSKIRMPSENKLEFASRKVWEFLVALTLKDCSLMIVFQRPTDSSSSSITSTVTDDAGSPYIFSLAIADLDSKPISKVEKVFQDNLYMIESYYSAIRNGVTPTNLLK